MKKLMIVAVLLLSVSMTAQAADRFFTVLYDVPILSSLEVVPELSYKYDTLMGKIAHAAAVTKTDPAFIYKAYRVSLKQFGWKIIGKHAYSREGEILSISHESLDEAWLFHFTVRPNQENSHK
ncbi:MAG: hypothetical protein CMH31_01005 [Micavibrio sp.]|nr:hypothetical protein [Micavibrio sp.]